MRAIESLLSRRQQLFNKTKPREIVAVKGGNKFVIDGIASEWVFYYTFKKTESVRYNFIMV